MFVTAKARLLVDSTGVPIDVIAVLTPSGVLLPLVDYFRLHARTRSPSWQIKVAHGLVLFLEYMYANPAEGNSQLLFQNFALRLATGTFELESRWDSSGLCWKARPPSEVRRIVQNLSDFFKHLKRDRPQNEQINPIYESSTYDRMVDQAAYLYRRNSAMLGHAWSPNAPNRGDAAVRVSRKPQVAVRNSPAFPEARFEELLVKGFLGGARPDYRGACITLLQHGAGFRESEPFHLFIQDVFPDPNDLRSSCVHIHHPEWGAPPLESNSQAGQVSGANRADYLATRYGLKPRNVLTGKLRAGWKNPLLDEKYFMRAAWFPDYFGRWFSELWSRYLQQLLNVARPHPWAFVNLSRAPVGAPYTISTFNHAHGAACERIGLKVSKALGTTPHGHRHAYGQRARSADLDKQFIKLFMHHKSLESQETYTQPTASEMRAALADGVNKLAKAQSLPSRPLLGASDTD